MLEQIVDNVNQYKHGFDVTVSVKRCPAASSQMTRRLKLIHNTPQIGGETVTHVPYFHLCATDWPEGQDCTGTLQGAVCSLRNCRECEHLTAEFNDTSKFAARRTQQQSVEAWRKLENAGRSEVTAARKELKNLSLQPYASPFIHAQLFAGPGGFHEIFPMDGLHGISGICQVLLFFLKEFGDEEVSFFLWIMAAASQPSSSLCPPYPASPPPTPPAGIR